MESNKRPFTDILLQTVFALAVFIIYIWLRKRWKLKLPLGPKGYPIVGCSPMLGGDVHLTLHKWTHEYGDVYGFYLGGAYVVVVSNPKIFHSYFNQATYVQRTPNLFPFMPHGAVFLGIGNSSGPEYAEQRRFTMREVENIGLGRNYWHILLLEEVEDFVTYLEDFKGKPVDYTSHLSSSLSNNILSFVTGNPLSPDNTGRQILLEGTKSFEILHEQSGQLLNFPKLYKLVTRLNPTSLAPHFRNLWNLGEFIQKEVEKSMKEENNGQTYITGYMKEMKDASKKGNNSFTESNLLGNVQELILAGTDTTLMSIKWLLLAMATHPRVQENVYQELYSVLGHSEEPISYLTHKELFPYCCATIEEALRWRTVVPFNVYPRCTEDIKLAGYDIPAGSYLIEFLWAFHNNPHDWPEPDRFVPERFLDKFGNFNNYGFAPFSTSPRKCPGQLVAYMQIFAYFTSIIRKFEVLLPQYLTFTKFDRQGVLSLTLQPKPHELQFVSRE